ncbi:MAG: PRC-barrel domain-containing protein [Methanobrevibacter sp.]|nr:PRC-barrel domain-containing protein [Methanobrevibacter sp.]
MNIKSIIGKNVIDKRAEKIGKIEDMDLNTKTGQINSVLIDLKKNVRSQGKIIVEYEHVTAVGEYVFIDIEVE